MTSYIVLFGVAALLASIALIVITGSRHRAHNR
jgi:hypothetical protein